ncbi:FR47-like protein [Flavobacterium araucananum]|uniref:GNAT family N-acetyltransferase n=1 Tax=Flavobacterium araucananum TaxID=946678 RepID=A0A227NXP3_9FLAO|nr:GNAT family N-acetyltransferase [Flavobacterium araucananum]OXG01716.1 GNAT family N-acetyltransferase [Flavobacterium araucananum]PWK00451.1 FR47-like protein [Flavobacterium araucananum]
MKNTEENKLDNPVLNSLAESHAIYAIDYDGTQFYDPDYCPFGGFINPETTWAAIDQYAELAQNFFIVGEKPEISNSLKIVKELICLQMIIYDKIEQPITSEIVKLTKEHHDELIELVNLVQPGYFKNKTTSLGNYYGIFKDNQLVAITGERMKMTNFTEVSAIITHPDHTGKGYAKQLITHGVNTIFSQNKIPYLHVVETNLGAIALYEKLGFVTRRKISFWNIAKNQ